MTPPFIMLFFCVSTYAQDSILRQDTVANIHLNPLLLSSFKKPLKLNPVFNEYIKPSKFELMRWPNYPLTAAQIEARDREWDRNNNLPFGQKMAKDAIDIFIMQPLLNNSVNTLIYGKKKPPSTIPKF